MLLLIGSENQMRWLKMENKNLEEKLTRTAHKMFSAILKRKIAEIKELDATKEHTEATHPHYQQRCRDFKISIKNMEKDLKEGFELSSTIAENKIFLERYEQARKKLENDCEGLTNLVCQIEQSLQKISNYNKNELINYRKNFFPKPGGNYGKM